MKFEGRLTSQAPTAQHFLDFNPQSLIIMNNAPYAVLVRRGIASLPVSDSYDYIIPAGMYVTLATVGNEFGLALDIATGVTTGIAHQPCTYIFVADEPIPTFSQSSFREAFTLVSPGSFGRIIDARGAKALVFEFSYNPAVPPANRSFFNFGEFKVWGFNVPATGVLHVLKVVNAPYGNDTVRGFIPVTTDVIQLFWNPLAASQSFLSYSLLDSIPSVVPGFITSSAEQPSRTNINYPVGASTVAFQDQMRGKLTTLEIVLEVPHDSLFDVSFELLVQAEYFTESLSVHNMRITDRPETVLSLTRLRGPMAPELVDVTYNDAGSDFFHWRIPLDIWIAESFTLNIFPNLPFTSISLFLESELEVS